MEPPCLPSDLTSLSAFVCQQVLYDQDALISAIRIIDTITVRKLATAETAIVELFVVVLAKSSAPRPSERTMRVDLIHPQGKRSELGSGVAKFNTSPDNDHPIGATLVIQIELAIRETGLYWINIELENETVAKLPLTLSVQIVQEI